MAPPSPAHLVIFDCDGVLVDSELISCATLARMLTDEGLPTTMPDARRDYQGLRLDDVVRRAEGRLGRPLPQGWVRRFEAERAESFRRELRAVPGAAEAVRVVASAGVGVCVASQAKLSKTELSLSLTGLDHLFADAARFSADSVARGKPAPDLFLHAASEMGADPDRCVVIEDTPSGVVAAVAAGMRALGYAADAEERALSEAGAEAFPAMHALPALLGL